MKDITERELNRQQLEKSEERYRIAAEQTGQVIFDFKLETGEIEWAGAIKEVTGHDPEEFKMLNVSVWLENVHPDDRTRMLEMLRKSFEKKEKFEMEFRFRKKDGSYIYIEERVAWLKDGNGQTHRAIGVMDDVSEWKRAVEKIQASERKYRSFIQNFQGIAFQIDENLNLMFVHGAVKKITGYTEEELISEINWQGIIYPEDLPLVFKENKSSSPYSSYGEISFRITRKDSRIIWVNVIYQRFKRREGNPNYYQGIIYDVTEKKETEKFLANIEIARQKELHHRIKNNLQVISSLLDLQADKFRNKEWVKDSEVLDAFRENQDRIISIALIHEELHKVGGTDTLNFSSYIQKLVENLFHTYSLGNVDVSLNMDLEENIFLDMDTAVPLGLIVNELVSNSLKHAFPVRKTGEIRIKLYRKEFDQYSGIREEAGFENSFENRNNDLILIVSDNGVGIPETVDFENPETLGLQLISTLANQLDGKIEQKRENGTMFILEFKVKNRQP
jgi:PAS domain S-box-containing protein